ncbi:MAG: AraC family transcriptional regulator [Paenibacillus sp.]|nr:AraC family transcriptional regulator [Paenibacillus sp.]
MVKPDMQQAPDSFENVNMKVRIDSLLFDILFDRTLVQRRFGPGQPIAVSPKHSHASYEVHFILSGSGTLFIEEDKRPVAAGSIHVIGPHIFHTLRQFNHDPITRVTFRFTFQEQFPHDPWFPETETKQVKTLLQGVSHYCFPDADRKISLLMEQIRSELERPSLGSYATVQGLLTYVMMQLIRAIPEHNSSYSLPSKLKDEQRSLIVDHFFAREYNRELTVHMLALQLNLSVKQVNRLLHKLYRSTFKQKLIDTRIEVAKNLLLNSQLSIQQIAEEVNYSVPYFCLIFKQKTGVPPSQYRLMHRA